MMKQYTLDRLLHLQILVNIKNNFLYSEHIHYYCNL